METSVAATHMTVMSNCQEGIDNPYGVQLGHSRVLLSVYRSAYA